MHQHRSLHHPHHSARILAYLRGSRVRPTNTGCWLGRRQCCRADHRTNPHCELPISTCRTRRREGLPAGQSCRAGCRTAEDVVPSTAAPDLYRSFFRDYTRKQWAAIRRSSIAPDGASARPRNNTDDRYLHRQVPGDARRPLLHHLLENPRPSEHTSTRVDIADDARTTAAPDPSRASRRILRKCYGPLPNGLSSASTSRSTGALSDGGRGQIPGPGQRRTPGSPVHT